jgi:redox-sensitive bicupin YhaK (pirin superfamily)
MHLDEILERKGPGTRVRVLSGMSGDVSVAANTHLPMMMLDIHMASRSSFPQEIPRGYNGFIYVLDGEITAGGKLLKAGDVGWLDSGEGALTIQAGPAGARSVLYAGEPQRVPLVMHGPFVGETRDDLMRVSRDYRDGRLPKVSELSERRK